MTPALWEWATRISSGPDSVPKFAAQTAIKLTACPGKLTFDEKSLVHRVYLTQHIYQTGLESQLPHKTVNLTFKLVIVNTKLKIL
jgi:hypothetical protein